MDAPHSPPALAERLLRRLLGRRASAPYIVADLREEFAQLAARSPAAARRFYWTEALRIGLRLRIGHPTTPVPTDLTGLTDLTDPTDPTDLTDLTDLSDPTDLTDLTVPPAR